MDLNEIWKKTLFYLESDIKASVSPVSTASFNTYIKPANPVSYRDNVLTVSTSLKMGKFMIETHLKKHIETALTRATGEIIKLEVVLGNSNPLNETVLTNNPSQSEQTAPPAGQPVHQQGSVENNSTYINPKYSFEKFVVGSSNKYAYNVAEAVAESPGHEYNPLFLYGNSGLGKTHLMLAIGNYIKEHNPEMTVTYVSSERFTIDMINALRDKKMDEFRRMYRETDVLLIDDIQFIEGKDSIQEEFFHTFNDLYNSNRQIVITSDRMPKNLTNLAKRLITRFDCGITTDIGVPDYETRMAILKKKAESENVNISDEIFDYIADRVTTNVRELEGALLKIMALSKMSDKEIDIKFAEESLKKILPEDKILKITHKDIKEKVCVYYNVTMEELLGQSRTQDIATARQVAMYLCKKLTDMTPKRIGFEFGNRDRTTVSHAAKKIAQEIERDDEIRAAVDSLIKDLQTI